MTPLAPVDPALAARFRADLEAALGRPLAPDAAVALAVSGGPDSMAMLALATAAFPGQIVAATVDHRLRPAAAAEAQMVAAWCVAIGVPHATLVVQDAIGPTAVQAQARARRYALLLRWAVDAGAQCLATAHHADDQAETFLMRAARGAGVAGLAGIRAHRRMTTAADAIAVVRPLLGWRSSALRGVATAAGMPFVDDPSNADPHYERTRFRTLLHAAPLLDPVRIARSAAAIADADAGLREIERWLWRTRTVAPADVADAAGQCWLDMTDLPRELKRRMCRAAIAAVRAANAIDRPSFDDSANIEPLLDALEAGGSATQAGVIGTVRGSVWRFAEQPPRRTR